MSFEVYCITVAAAASTTSNVSLNASTDKLWLEVTTFPLSGTTGTVLFVYGSRSVGGTYWPIALENVTSATTGPPIPAWLGAGTNVGGYLLDCTPAIGIRFLNVNLTSVTTATMAFNFISFRKFA